MSPSSTFAGGSNPSPEIGPSSWDAMEPWPVPPAWRAMRAYHRRHRLAHDWPYLQAHLAIQTHAGADLPSALASSLSVLPDPLRTEVEELVADLRTAPLPEALNRFVQRCNLSAAIAFVEETRRFTSNPSAN